MGWSPAPARFLRAAPRGNDDEELFALAERVRARVSTGSAPRWRPASAAPWPPASPARVPRGALRARGAECRRSAGNGAARPAAPALLATYRDLGSFQLLLSLQDDDALRLFCDSILSPIEAGEGAYGGELMRSLEAFIECNGQWERAARQLFCHRHTLRYRIRRVEELTGRRWTRRATGSSSGSRCAGASSVTVELPTTREEIAVKVGVPTEIKTDEYRVALTPAGVRELVEHGHEVSSRPARARARRSPTTTTPRRARTIVPDADAVFGEAELIVKVKEPQPEEVARLEPRHTLFTYLHLAPDPELTARAGRVGRDLHRLRDRRGRARAAAAARADERGRGQDRHPGRRVHAREAARRPRHPARRRPRRRGGEGDGHRRRRRRHERGVHRDRHGGRGLRLRPQHRPPARARHPLRRPRLDVLRVHAGDRAAPARDRPRDRRGARPRGQGAARRSRASNSR